MEREYFTDIYALFPHTPFGYLPFHPTIFLQPDVLQMFLGEKERGGIRATVDDSSHRTGKHFNACKKSSDFSLAWSYSLLSYIEPWSNLFVYGQLPEHKRKEKHAKPLNAHPCSHLLFTHPQAANMNSKTPSSKSQARPQPKKKWSKTVRAIGLPFDRARGLHWFSAGRWCPHLVCVARIRATPKCWVNRLETYRSKNWHRKEY